MAATAPLAFVSATAAWSRSPSTPSRCSHRSAQRTSIAGHSARERASRVRARAAMSSFKYSPAQRLLVVSTYWVVLLGGGYLAYKYLTPTREELVKVRLKQLWGPAGPNRPDRAAACARVCLCARGVAPAAGLVARGAPDAREQPQRPVAPHTGHAGRAQRERRLGAPCVGRPAQTVQRTVQATQHVAERCPPCTASGGARSPHPSMQRTASSPPPPAPRRAAPDSTARCICE